MRVRRSIVWTNAIDWEDAVERLSSGADAMCIDLEDGVSLDKKPAARVKTVEMVKTWDFGGMERIVRVNPMDSDQYPMDMEEVVAKALPDAIRIPKCELPSEILRADADLRKIEQAAGLPENTIEILAMIESPLGIRNAYDIAVSCKRVTAISLGMEDLTREMGVKRRYVDNELDLIYARQKFVLDAKAAKVQAIDSVLLMRANSDELNKRQNASSKQMGFDGRSCHTKEQVRWANETFKPDEKEVEWAREAVKAYEENSKNGTVLYDGLEICYAAYEKALALIEKARVIEEKEAKKK